MARWQRRREQGRKEHPMKLAVVAAVGSYTPADLEHKKRSLQTVLRPDTQLDMFAADSGVPYVESSLELYLSEVAVARKIVEVAGLGYQALVLGCGATTGLAPRVARELGIPVLDPGLTAVKYAEMLVDLGLSQSKRAYPYNPRVMQLLAGLAAGSA